jgi:hypothetical protein
MSAVQHSVIHGTQDHDDDSTDEDTNSECTNWYVPKVASCHPKSQPGPSRSSNDRRGKQGREPDDEMYEDANSKCTDRSRGQPPKAASSHSKSHEGSSRQSKQDRKPTSATAAQSRTTKVKQSDHHNSVCQRLIRGVPGDRFKINRCRPLRNFPGQNLVVAKMSRSKCPSVPHRTKIKRLKRLLHQATNLVTRWDRMKWTVRRRCKG